MLPKESSTTTSEAQRYRLVALLAVFSLLLHLVAYQAYKEAHGTVDRLVMGVFLLGTLSSSVTLLMSQQPRPHAGALRLAALFPAVAWSGVTLFHTLQQQHPLRPAELMGVGILTALALALLPFGAAVALSVGTYLALCTVALLTGAADILTLLVLGVLLLALVLSSEYGERVRRERERAELLEWLAQRDGLTGLLNRSATEQQLQAWLCQPGNRGCLLMLDLDSFKQINDQHGHPVGDRALQYTADVLRRLLGPEDLAGRWGGEEFVVLLAGRSAADLQDLVSQLRQDLRRSVQAGLPLLTASGGSACTEEVPSPALDTLIALADQRLYQAKVGGRDHFVWLHPPPPHAEG